MLATKLTTTEELEKYIENFVSSNQSLTKKELYIKAMNESISMFDVKNHRLWNKLSDEINRSISFNESEAEKLFHYDLNEDIVYNAFSYIIMSFKLPFIVYGYHSYNEAIEGDEYTFEEVKQLKDGDIALVLDIQYGDDHLFNRLFKTTVKWVGDYILFDGYDVDTTDPDAYGEYIKILKYDIKQYV